MGQFDHRDAVVLGTHMISMDFYYSLSLFGYIDVGDKFEMPQTKLPQTKNVTNNCGLTFIFGHLMVTLATLWHHFSSYPSKIGFYQFSILYLEPVFVHLKEYDW